MKKLYVVSSVAIIIFAFAFVLFPKNTSSKPLSPALSVLSGNITVKKCGLKGQKISFSSSDFKSAVGSKNLGDIKINAIPGENEGVLYVSNTPAVSGQTLKASEINKLNFIPESNNTEKAVFFISSDSFGFENAVECDIFLSDGKNSSPVVNNEPETLNTYKNIMVFSNISAVDADGDTIEFEITKQPKHGTVCFSKEKSGEFTYTPAENYTGSDVFEYMAKDNFGNCSATVKKVVNIEKTKGNLFFEDMKCSPLHYYAVKACVNGFGKSVIVDGKQCFCPDECVSREDFYANVISLCCDVPKSTYDDVDFSDKYSIKEKNLSAICFGLKNKLISTNKTSDGVFFYPKDNISRAEAIAVISNCLELSISAPVSVFLSNNSVPAWSMDLLDMLGKEGIETNLFNIDYSLETKLTNAQSAELLCSVYSYINKKL